MKELQNTKWKHKRNSSFQISSTSYLWCGRSNLWLHWTQNNCLTDMNSCMQLLFQFVPFKEEIIHDCQNCQIWILLIIMHEVHNCYCLHVWNFPCFVNKSGCSRRASRRRVRIVVNWSIVSICQKVTNGIWDIEQRILMLLDFLFTVKGG